MKTKGLALSALLAVLVCGAAAAAAAEIKVGGGGAAINTAFKPVKAPFEKATGITLVLFQSTPKNGMIDLVRGQLDAAVAAVPLESMIKGAEADGVKVDVASLQKAEVARNKTVMLLHRNNPVKKLSKEQLKGMFTGKIQNWKEVGGSDMPIIVVWGKASPGQNAQFTREILDGEPVLKDRLDSTDYAGIKHDVSTNPEAIGIDPVGLADEAVSVPESPELTSSIIVVTKGAPSPEVQKLIDFIKGEGKQYVK